MNDAVSKAKLKLAKAETEAILTRIKEIGDEKISSQDIMDLAALSYAQGLSNGYSMAKTQGTAI